MKARLIHYFDEYRLLLCTGKILTLTGLEACDFLLNFDNPSYYEGPGKWDHEGLTMESHGGDTIAYVGDDGSLYVKNSSLLRDVFSYKEIKYLTVPEYAELHGKKTAIIRRFCLANRIPGAIQKGKKWLIPENSPYPETERMGN